jgi:hypothetical protein
MLSNGYCAGLHCAGLHNLNAPSSGLRSCTCFQPTTSCNANTSCRSQAATALLIPIVASSRHYHHFVAEMSWYFPCANTVSSLWRHTTILLPHM